MTPQVSLFPAPPAPDRMPRAVGRWLADAPSGWVAPGHVEHYLSRHIRRARAAEVGTVHLLLRGEDARTERAALADRIMDESAPWVDRREIASAVADRIEAINGGNPASWLATVADSLRRCRTSGVVGVRGKANKTVVAWDHKCSMSRLCPDCSRAESRRVSERYAPTIEGWLANGRGRRWRYAVVTERNRPLGQLLSMKRDQAAAVRQWLRALDAAPGAVTVQEDPLSWRGDWHVHTNVAMLVDGDLDYGAARAALIEAAGRPMNVEFVKPPADAVGGTLREVMKYSAQSVPTKSADKLARHASPAPPLVAWSDAALTEWVSVQVGRRADGARRRAPFRRVRSYGVLHSVDACRWGDADLHARLVWTRDSRLLAEHNAALGRAPSVVLPERAAVTPWRALDKTYGKGSRDAVRALWRIAEGLPLETVPLDSVVCWMGSIRYGPDARAFEVDLIPGDNFRGRTQDIGVERQTMRTGCGPPYH